MPISASCVRLLSFVEDCCIFFLYFQLQFASVFFCNIRGNLCIFLSALRLLIVAEPFLSFFSPTVFFGHFERVPVDRLRIFIFAGRFWFSPPICTDFFAVCGKICIVCRLAPWAGIVLSFRQFIVKHWFQNGMTFYEKGEHFLQEKHTSNGFVSFYSKNNTALISWFWENGSFPSSLRFNAILWGKFHVISEKSIVALLDLKRVP